MDRQSDREIADTTTAIDLLGEWFRWSDAYRPNLGVPGVAPYCKDSRTSRQYDEAADLTHDRVYQAQMETVDFCMDAIAAPMRQSIGAEMRCRELNAEVRAKVWRSRQGVSFSDALAVVMIVMRKKGLFD